MGVSSMICAQEQRNTKAGNPPIVIPAVLKPESTYRHSGGLQAGIQVLQGFPDPRSRLGACRDKLRRDGVVCTPLPPGGARFLFESFHFRHGIV